MSLLDALLVTSRYVICDWDYALNRFHEKF